MTTVLTIDAVTAAERARRGDLDGAIELARRVIAEQFESGAARDLGPATSVLVESLLRRRRAPDIDEARSAIETLAAVPTDPGFVFHELPLLRMRALLASADGEAERYRTYADRYRVTAQSLQFDGHLASARRLAAPADP